jgi:hypothetical protein
MTLQITRHDTSDIVELSDGSRWRIFPADVPATLRWLGSTEFDILAADDELWSHVLVNREENSPVRVIAATENWPREKLRRSLKKG